MKPTSSQSLSISKFFVEVQLIAKKNSLNIFARASLSVETKSWAVSIRLVSLMAIHKVTCYVSDAKMKLISPAGISQDFKKKKKCFSLGFVSWLFIIQRSTT